MSTGLGTVVGSLISNDAVIAKVPCRLNVNYVRWLGTRLHVLLIWCFLFCISVALAFFTSWGHLLGFLLVLMACGYLFRVWKFFWYGCLTPAIVVSEDPVLIAAFTDLSQNEQYCPHLKVARYETQAPVKLGKRVTTVASYVIGNSGRKWADFRPVPLDHAVADPEILRTAENRIPPEQWYLLGEAVKTLPGPFVEGLYEVDCPSPNLPSNVQCNKTTSERPVAKRVSLVQNTVVGCALVAGLIALVVFLKSDPYGRAVRQGDAYAKIGDIKSATSAYVSAIHKDPDNPVAYFHRAVVYQRAAEHLKAQADFDEVIRKRPEFGPAYRLRALTMQAQRLNERAQADNTEADRLGAPKTITDPFGYDL